MVAGRTTAFSEGLTLMNFFPGLYVRYRLVDVREGPEDREESWSRLAGWCVDKIVAVVVSLLVSFCLVTWGFQASKTSRALSVKN